MLEALNYIAYGFFESSTEYLIDEKDQEYLSQELCDYFPPYLVKQDTMHCFEILINLYEWFKDNYYHPLNPLHEYVLAKTIQDKWNLFYELSEDESQDFRDVYYSLPESSNLSQGEAELIADMKNDESITLNAFFKRIDFGELELTASFYQEPFVTFLRF